MEPVSVSAAGANTSLGTLVPAAAAARTRMINAQELDLTEIAGGEGVDGAACHRVEGVDAALSGPERLRAIWLPAVRDLRAALAKKNLRLGRTGIYLATGEADDDPAGRELLAADAAATLEFSPVEKRLFGGGRSGTNRAIEAALAAVAAGRVDQAIVGACESQLDPVRLAESLAAGRLKTADYPVGFMPGEAAALVVLESVATATARAFEPAPLLFPPAMALEESSYAAGRPGVGKALSKVIVEALERTAATTDAGSVYLDLNGEAYRATDWGMALVRVRQKLALELVPELVTLCFGELGAPYPLLSIALAASAFARGYARGRVVLVCSSSDSGERAAYVLRPV